MSVENLTRWGYYAISKSGEPNEKEMAKMDDQVKKEFYREEIAKMIDQISDTDVLDLVYKILLAEG